MRYIVLCDDVVPLFFTQKDSHQDILFLCETAMLKKRLVQGGANCRYGNLLSRRMYQRHKVCAADRIAVFMRDEKARGDVLGALMKHTDVCDISLIEAFDEKKATDSDSDPRVRSVPFFVVCRNGLINEMEKTVSAARIRTLQSIFHGQEKVLFLLHHDPDPDAIASALAMRTLLGRNKASAPIASFGKVTRPENQAMLKLLEIEVIQIEPDELQEFNRIVMLDVQPSHFREIRFPVHVIIDHHPETESVECLYKDIHAHYGATSTILTEYLQAADIKITQKLATALLYGIKTDTLLLGRETVRSDLRAYSDLYPMANHRLIRRMERPQLPKDDLNVLSKAFKNAHIVDDVLFVHLDELTREDIVPYIADFCLEVEGMEWAVVSGIFDKKLVISARNYGYSRSAGEIMRLAFSEYGSAGGHRSMAKAVMPLDILGDKITKGLNLFVRNTFLNNYRVS